MTLEILAILSTLGLELIHWTPRYACENILNENALLISKTKSLSAVQSCTFQHLPLCTATYEPCKTIVLNSTIIIVQCVQGNFYKNLQAFNFGYFTNTMFLKVLTDKLFQIDTN